MDIPGEFASVTPYPRQLGRCTTNHSLTPQSQIEGMFTVLVGILFIALFPLSSAKPVSLLGVRYFSERESQILQQRVLRDDPTKAQPRQSVTLGEIKDTVSLPR